MSETAGEREGGAVAVGHTPGPWFYHDRHVLGGDRAEYVCEVAGSVRNAFHQADAALIVAAPLLLAKCEQVVRWLDRLAKHSEGMADGWADRLPAFAEECRRDAKNFRATADDVRAAIAKARALTPESESRDA